MSYAKLINIMREEGARHNPSLPFIGEVTSITPLKVKFSGITLDEDQIYQLSDSYTVGQTALVLPTSGRKYGVLGVVK